MALRLSPSTAKATLAFGQILTPCEGPPSAADSFSDWRSPAPGLCAYISLSPPSRDHGALTASQICTKLFSIQAGTEVPFRICCPCSAIHQTAKNNQIGYGDCLLSWALKAHLAGEELEGLSVVSSMARSLLHPWRPSSLVCLGLPTQGELLLISSTSSGMQSA